MYVAYGGKAGRYHCEGALVNHGTERCISFGGLRADHAVGMEVLRVLKPLGIDAAVKALDAQAGTRDPPASRGEGFAARSASQIRFQKNTVSQKPPCGHIA